jgi:hypothetical protein
VKRGLFTKEDFLEMVRVVDREMRRKRNISNSGRITELFLPETGKIKTCQRIEDYK